MPLEKKDTDWYILYKNKNTCDYLIKILQKQHIPFYVPTSMEEEYEDEQLVKKTYESINNLIFVQPTELANLFLCKIKTEFGLEITPYNDCMTGDIAKVSNDEMQRFIKISQTEPNSIELLKDCYEKFSDKPRVRIKAGPYEGLDGRLVRIRRDRKVVISLGRNAVSISGIHFSLLEFY